MDKWRCIISGDTNPSLNMGTDYAIWKAVGDKKIPATLRFYTWQPSAVSIGYNQKAEELINLEYCRQNNIPVVRRPTGGSAIFHDAELTYSFCANTDESEIFSSPLKAYISICKGIVNGFESLGITSEIRGFSEGKEPSYTRENCFALTSRHDIVHRGQKIVGSAQRWGKNAFLQHGSILLDIRKDKWERIFINSVDFNRVSSVSDIKKSTTGTGTLIKSVKEGLEKVFDMHIVESSLTRDEEKNSMYFSKKLFSEL
jgi:lipoyl(octanoyl) transferase